MLQILSVDRLWTKMLLDKTIIFNARNWGGCKTEKLSSINCILSKNQSNYITVVVCNCVAVFVHGSDPVRCQALNAYKATSIPVSAEE